MIPTIGRAVHYFINDTGDTEQALRPNAAVVVSVHNTTLVDLFVMDPSEHSPYYAYNVVQGNGESQWNWPPRV